MEIGIVDSAAARLELYKKIMLFFSKCGKIVRTEKLDKKQAGCAKNEEKEKTKEDRFDLTAVITDIHY